MLNIITIIKLNKITKNLFKNLLNIIIILKNNNNNNNNSNNNNNNNQI